MADSETAGGDGSSEGTRVRLSVRPMAGAGTRTTVLPASTCALAFPTTSDPPQSMKSQLQTKVPRLWSTETMLRATKPVLQSSKTVLPTSERLIWSTKTMVWTTETMLLSTKTMLRTESYDADPGKVACGSRKVRRVALEK